MSKQNAFAKVTPITKPLPPEADAFVSARTADVSERIGSAPAEPMKRFTIDVSESLHKRIKTQCAGRGVKMADVIRELLEREFPTGAA